MWVGDILPRLFRRERSFEQKGLGLQKDILSTRVLRFTEKHLTFHCRTVSCSEHNPTGPFNLDRKAISAVKIFTKSILSNGCVSPIYIQDLHLQLVFGTPIGSTREPCVVGFYTERLRYPIFDILFRSSTSHIRCCERSC